MATEPAVPHHLPPIPTSGRVDWADLLAPLTTFVGREAETVAAGSLLREPAVRLVTLVGPGGVGKTRLALALAAELGQDFPGGVAFVALAAVRDPESVAPTIAQALGLRPAGRGTAADLLAAALRTSRALLVLDNFEQVLPGASVVADLLLRCPRVTVLVTSRERLRLSGERVFPVPPLSLTNRGTDSDAVRLFVQRAREASPDVVLTDAGTPIVAEICARLDGLPLAIELAAARLVVLPPGALLRRLEQRLPLLTGGPRDAPVRQRTLRDAIAWNYELLPPRERAFFRRLAVFSGSFSLEAAEAVAEGELDLVASLVEKSLLRREVTRGGDVRLQLLETIREFGLERLEASADAEAVRRDHAVYYTTLAVRYQWVEMLPDMEDVLTLLEAEHANFLAALTWLEAAGEAESALRLATALGRFVTGPGPHVWLERALARDGAVSAGARASALVALGIDYLYQGANREAEARLAEGLAHCRNLGDALNATYALIGLGRLALARGDAENAAERLDEAVATVQGVVDPRLAAIMAGRAVANLAGVARMQGDFPLAVDRLEEALRLDREVGHLAGVVLSLGDLGDVARDQHDYPRAAARYREALGLFQGNPDMRMVNEAIEGMATVATAVGQPQRAARLLGAAAA